MIKQQPFYIGQEVVCIKTHSQGVVKKKDKLRVFAIKQSDCCGMWLVDVGVRLDYNGTQGCVCGSTTIFDHPIWWLCASLFAPIDEGFEEIEYSKIIEKEKVCAS